MPNRPCGEALVEYDKTEYAATLEYSDTGVMTVQLKYPLEKINLKIDDNGCRVEYDGVKLEYSSEQAKSFCPFWDVYELLKLVCYNEPGTVRSVDGKYVLEYADSTRTCKAISDKSENLEKIESENMVIKFKTDT